MGISKVAVVGLGYIGLPTAAILAAHEVSVVGVDVNPATVAAVNAGEVPFVEPDLGTLLAGAVSKGRLRAVGSPEPADAFILAVPTPFKDDHAPDLSYIEAAAEAIAPVLKGGELIVLESTSPPGATRQLADWILALRPDLAGQGGEQPLVEVAYCPERVLPGHVIDELVHNDRVLGGLTPQAAERARELYALFCKGELVLTDATTAEMTKLVENAFRDVNLAFANEVSLIADSIGVDVWELIALANRHPRVNILKPGPGVGGHCIAVDPWFIVSAAPELAKLIRRARNVNDGKPTWVAEQILTTARSRDARTIALLGLAFKPDIDDLRESPARRIAERVATELADRQILVVEPHISQLPPELERLENITLVGLDSLTDAELVVELVAHTRFADSAHTAPADAEFLAFARPAQAA